LPVRTQALRLARRYRHEINAVTIVEDRPPAGDEGARASMARRAMIDSQLRTSGVNAEPVLRRMAEVARERFVPERARGFRLHRSRDRARRGRQLAAPVVRA
jgi:protein-L-isoaspartate(D-aspartate) O-methyltransferase